MRMIADWRQSWRLWSVRVSALGATLYALLLAAPDQALALWNVMPPEVQALVPNRTVLGIALFATSAGARMLRQRGGSDAEA